MEIRKIIIESLNELNESLENKIEITESMCLMGNDGVLDSLDFVNLVVILEDQISDNLDLDISIADEKAFSRKKSPFLNINSLEEYLKEIINE